MAYKKPREKKLFRHDYWKTWSGKDESNHVYYDNPQDAIDAYTRSVFEQTWHLKPREVVRLSMLDDSGKYVIVAQSVLLQHMPKRERGYGLPDYFKEVDNA